MELGTVKDLSIVIAGLIALVTFVFSAWQFRRQVRNMRVEHFVTMRRRFLEDPVFRSILTMVTSGDPAISQTPIQDRRNFVGFFEEVALMVNSGLVRPEIAHYMFGYYTRLVDECVPFWEGLDRESQYWAVFRAFAHEMREAAARPPDAHLIKF